MKTLTIYTRKVLERTGYRKYPYKEVEQISIFYDGKETKNHYEEITNPRLKIKFNKALETRSLKKIETYLSTLGRTDAAMFQKAVISR